MKECRWEKSQFSREGCRSCCPEAPVRPVLSAVIVRGWKREARRGDGYVRGWVSKGTSLRTSPRLGAVSYHACKENQSTRPFTYLFVCLFTPSKCLPRKHSPEEDWWSSSSPRVGFCSKYQGKKVRKVEFVCKGGLRMTDHEIQAAIEKDGRDQFTGDLSGLKGYLSGSPWTRESKIKVVECLWWGQFWPAPL